jgi:hypothetical protein
VLPWHCHQNVPRLTKVKGASLSTIIASRERFKSAFSQALPPSFFLSFRFSLLQRNIETRHKRLSCYLDSVIEMYNSSRGPRNHLHRQLSPRKTVPNWCSGGFFQYAIYFLFPILGQFPVSIWCSWRLQSRWAPSSCRFNLRMKLTVGQSGFLVCPSTILYGHHH